MWRWLGQGMVNDFWISRKGSSVALALIPKCARTTIHSAVGWRGTEEMGDLDWLLQHPTRIAWVRDPLQRFYSGWSMFHAMAKQDLQIGRSWSGRIPIDACLRYETYVDWALQSDEIHVMPQTDLLTHDNVFLPTNVYRMEELEDTFPKEFLDGRRPVGDNAWVRQPVSGYREKALLLKYAADTAMRKELDNGYCMYG